MTLPEKNTKRILIAALLLVIFTLFSALALRPLQLRMLKAIEDARDALIAQAEAALGKVIAYESAGLAFPVMIDIRGLSLTGGREGGIPDISAARVRIRYSLREIFDSLREEDGLGKIHLAVKEIIIDRPETVIKVNAAAPRTEEAGAEVGFFVPDIQRELQKVFAFLPDGLIVRLNKGRVDAVAAAKEEESSGAGGFEGRGAFNAVTVDLRVLKGRVKLNASLQMETSVSSAAINRMNNRRPLAASTALQARFDFSVEDGSGRGTFRLSKIRSDFADLAQLALTATLENRHLMVEKIGGSVPYALSFGLDLDNGAADVDFSAERFTIRSYVTLKGAMRQYAPWIPDSVSGTTRITMTLGASPAFDVNLRGAFRQQSPIGSSSFVVRGRGDTVRARLSQLTLSTPQGDFGFSGNIEYRDIAVNGIFRVNNFEVHEGRPINGEFAIDTHDRTTTFFAETFFLGGVEFSAFNLEVTREERSAIIGISALRFYETGVDEETGFGDMRLGRLSSEGFFNWRENILDLSLALEEMPVKDLLDIAHVFVDVPELPDMADDVIAGTEFTVDVFVSTDFESITYSVPVFVMAYTGKEKNGKSTSITAAASISGTETHFTVVESTVNLPDGALNVFADFDFSDYNDIFFRAEFLYKDLFYYLSGQVLDQSSVTLTGSYNFQAFFSLGGTGFFSGYVRTEGALFPYKDQVVNVSLAASLRYDSANDWAFGLDRLAVQNILIGTTPIAALELRGSADQNGAILPAISITDSGGSLTGNGRANWNGEYNSIDFTIGLADTRSSEIFFAGGNYLDGALNLNLNATALKLSRFFRNSFNAAVSGVINFKIEDIFDKAFDNWSLTADITSLTAEVGNFDINIATHGEIRPAQFFLLDTRINWGGVLATVPSITFENSHLDAGVKLQGIIQGRNINLDMGASINFQNFVNLSHLAESLSRFDGAISLASMRIDDWTMEKPASFVFRRQDAAISLSGGPSNMVRLELQENGEFYAGFSAPSPVRGVVTGTIRNGTIMARGSNLYVDLLALWGYLPAQNIINIKGGFAIADIEVSGPLNDPEFYGTAQGSSIRLEIPLYLNSQVGPLPMTISLSGQQMRFGPVRAPCGTGYAMVTGIFEFSRWVPSNFTITIDAEEDHRIPYKVNIAGVKALGETFGSLEIALQDNVMNVTGNLVCENTEIMLDLAGLNFGVSSDMSMQIITDFTITTGRRVEFLWPNEDFPILQANPASGNSIHISSDSFSGGFELKGTIDIRSGEIFYIERSFYIREGTLTFNENETRFEPQIAARAEIRDRTNDGPVTISLVIDNQPLTSFQARFESTPALSQAEIFTLLGQSIVGGETDESGQIAGAFGGAITDVLSQFSVVRRMERLIRDSLHIDMFSVRTQAISNMVLQATGTQSEENAGSGFSRYFDNTTIFAGKYITGDLFIQGMLTFRYDDQLAKLNQSGLKLEPDIGIELRSPLFDIRWNIVPAHPEKLFIPDTSFTILWRRSF
jgi:hypothetical protein